MIKSSEVLIKIKPFLNMIATFVDTPRCQWTEHFIHSNKMVVTIPPTNAVDSPSSGFWLICALTRILLNKDVRVCYVRGMINDYYTEPFVIERTSKGCVWCVMKSSNNVVYISLTVEFFK